MQYRIDLFAVFIFLGIVQGFFLLAFFLSREHRKSKTNLFHGLFLLCIVACLTEIFLMYSGYIIHCLYLVDFSEAFGVAIGPCFYLLVLSLVHGTVDRKNYLHLVFPIIYFFLQLPFLILPEDAKYNAWIGTYHPDWAYRPFDYAYDPRLFWVTDNCTEFTIICLIVYGSLGLVEIFKAFRKKKESFWRASNPVLKTLRWEVFQLLSATVGILVVKLFHKEDTGDHLFAAYITVTIYLGSIRIVRESGFFSRPSLAEPQKYRTSALTLEAQKDLLEKLKKAMTETKPFVKPDFSLPELARMLGTSVHTLSQVINDGLGKNFFEMTAEYRVEEAKSLLKSQPNIKVEEIAGQVGYNSKSSFNTSFKKIAGKTPSEFRAGDKHP
ncbi:MAG TPA: helix-turn-helix domain-containing protein [Chryseolinea sp.]